LTRARDELDAPVRVLLVDDSADSREMYALFLAWSGLELVLASDGREAIARAETEHPDVIVMDLSLPGLDGWEATRALKADPRTAPIPVLALSGHGRTGRPGEEAFAGFLTKPCMPEDLIAEIRRVQPRPPQHPV
jgi:two-component system, cell cycle response regulator DivK